MVNAIFNLTFPEKKQQSDIWEDGKMNTFE